MPGDITATPVRKASGFSAHMLGQRCSPDIQDDRDVHFLFAAPRNFNNGPKAVEKLSKASSANKSRWAHVGRTMNTKRSQGLTNDTIVELLVCHERPQEVLEQIFGRYF